MEFEGFEIVNGILSTSSTNTINNINNINSSAVSFIGKSEDSKESPFELTPEDSRTTTFPIRRGRLWNLYIKARNKFWVPPEIDFGDDVNHYNKLDKNTKHFVDYINAFFSSMDGIVNMNIAKRFREEVPILEAGYFYDFQVMMENIHAETYSLMLDTYVKDAARRAHLLNAIKEIPVIVKIGKWITETCIDAPRDSATLGIRLFRMACIEGVLFNGCFAAIFWLRENGLMPGFAQANKFISIDEGLHTLFAIALITMLKPKFRPSHAEMCAVLDEVFALAADFMREALPFDLQSMNQRLMCQYIKYMCDNLLALLEEKAHFKVQNPFTFMEKINLETRTNFFEGHETNYEKSTNHIDTSNVVLTDDF